ncbi:MAG TPA: response regulator transcription factor [Dehalococcoidia bacterium]|nr:response regulator transcription factor [Dehalococcoidia bacterium]
MHTLTKNDYDDALDLINCCLSCLKSGGKTEEILYALLKSFKADQAVYLSASNNDNGVDLSNSYALCQDKSFLNQYAEYFWRYDPLYQMQFCPTPDNLVFKTDDIIPYSQMVKLEYYNSFLRPQNLLGELIIRLYSKGYVYGVISLQRFREHSNFNVNDTQKASLLVPYLNNIFETADKLIKINEERMLLEQWMESHSEGLILLDSKFSPLYCNSEAKLFCLLMNHKNLRRPDGGKDVDISIPLSIVQDCMNLTTSSIKEGIYKHFSNKIINIEQKKYHIQYFPVLLPSSKLPSPRFIIFVNELTRYRDNAEENYTTEYKLSEREESVARYAAIGLTNKQIAEKLCISPFTVQNHLKSIFGKTGIDNRTKLANFMKY